jgi:hypothetical protein
MIQCDEAKPYCGQCQDRRIQCDLAESKPSEEIKQNSSVAPKSTRQMIELYVRDMAVPCPEFKDPVYKKSHTMELLDHFFETKDVKWIGSTEFQKIMLERGLEFCLDAPYLVHAILAFSASHLNFLHPGEKRYAVAATLHYEHSLTSYSAKLRTPLTKENGDPVVGCCHIHTMLAFRNRTSSHYSGGFTWLRAMQGVRILWETAALRPHMPESCWYPVCMESKAGRKPNSCDHDAEDPSTWVATTSKALHRLCEMPPGQENPYEIPLAHLCRLMRLDKVDHAQIGIFMVFIGKLPASFVQLLDQNDPMAFLLVAYWATFLSRIDQWWIVDSTKMECMRLCAHLDTVPDPRIRELMKFPASSCGYMMKEPHQATESVFFTPIQPADTVSLTSTQTADQVSMPSINQLLI